MSQLTDLNFVINRITTNGSYRLPDVKMETLSAYVANALVDGGVGSIVARIRDGEEVSGEEIQRLNEVLMNAELSLESDPHAAINQVKY